MKNTSSKHHDGFALFDSKVSSYNVVDATPFKRDVLKELAEVCRRRKMPLGFYYSQSQDWHEPDGAGNDWDFGPDTGPGGKDLKSYDNYLRNKAEPQVRELLTNYGPVALIWFDTPRMMTHERAQRFTNLVRRLQPNTLIDGRAWRGGRLYIDRRQRGPLCSSNAVLGGPGYDEPHLRLSKGRSGLEVARGDYVQADRRCQQGRELSPECRADDGWRHPADPAREFTDCRRLAEGQWRGGIWRGSVSLGR